MTTINTINFIKYSTLSQQTSFKGFSKTEAREYQMIPKYLELAKVGEKYRFNEKEIKQISDEFKYYATNHCVTDILKKLLNVGMETNNPLSTQEIIGFLDATNNMKKIEQLNVLQFLNAAKTDEGREITLESLKKSYPYEQFKMRHIKLAKDKYPHILVTPKTTEKELKSIYEISIKNRLTTMSKNYHKNDFAINKCPISEYVTKNNKTAIYTISKSIDPEKLFSVVKETGFTNTVVAAANALVIMYKLGGENKDVVVDLARGFYPAEIKQIADYMMDKSRNTGQIILPELQNYVERTLKTYDLVQKTFDMPKLSTQRRNVLNEMGLQDEIKLHPLENYQDICAYSTTKTKNKKQV